MSGGTRGCCCLCAIDTQPMGSGPARCPPKKSGAMEARRWRRAARAEAARRFSDLRLVLAPREEIEEARALALAAREEAAEGGAGGGRGG